MNNNKRKKDLFLNIFDYTDDNYPFQIFIGGRGIGKTFGAFKGCVVDNRIEKKFIFMRRTLGELELMLDTKSGEGISDLKAINGMFNTNYGFASINKNLAGIYNRETDENGKIKHTGEPIGYGIALSTVANIRGVNLSDCSDLIYDEFIPERHVRKMKNEFDALMNSYETINRNREIQGEKPLHMWLLANSNDIYNPILIGLGIVNIAEKMMNKGQEHYYDKDRGLALHIMRNNQEFVEKKSNTALYKLTNNTGFAEMALSNSFSYNDFSLIAYRNIKGYIPFASVDNCSLYKKKGSREIYVSYAMAKTRVYNSSFEQDVILFRKEWGQKLYDCFSKSEIIFESYELKEKIMNIII